MKYLQYILILATAIACNAESAVQSPQKTKSFEQCFSQVDTTSGVAAVMGSGGFYKQLNDQYIIRIKSNLHMKSGECEEISIQPTDTSVVAELLIFEKGKASQINIYTDIISADKKEEKENEPIKRLNIFHGKIRLGETDAPFFFRSPMPETTIHILELTFVDSETKEQIVIKDELLWKVSNWQDVFYIELPE